MVPLAATMSAQVVASMMFMTVAVLAPAIAPSVGTSADTLAGTFSALIFGSAMFSALFSGRLIRRFGALRTTQAGLVNGVIALAVTTLLAWPLVLLGAVVLGIGYGPNTPSSSHLLARATPPHRRGLVFSIKQSGMPLGGVLAGLILPPAAFALGWQGALLLSAAIGLATAFALQPVRAGLDDDRDPRAALWRTNRPRALGRPELLRASPALARLTVSAFALAMLQAVMVAFFVTFIVRETGLGLVKAGVAFSILQVSGAIARVLFGWIADALIAPRFLLAVIALIGLVASGALFAAQPGWPFWLISLVSVVVGISATGWNGVFLAAVANVVPEDQVGGATGASSFFIFSGFVVAPLLFAVAATVTGHEGAGFLAAGILAAIAGAALVAVPQAGLR